MSQRVILPAAEPRCRPSRTCQRAGACQRCQAPLPDAGATVADFTAQPGFSAVLGCVQFLSAEAVRRMAAANAGAGAVHEPVRGLW